MRKNIFLLTGLLIVSSVLLSSCKKEAKIQKNLWNKSGYWKIESLVANQTSTDPTDNFTETIYNYGELHFKEDGSGAFTFTVDGDIEIGAFTYSNTEDKLTMIINSQARVFDIMEWEKDKMKISITENFTSDGESITYIETLNLIKT